MLPFGSLSNAFRCPTCASGICDQLTCSTTSTITCPFEDKGKDCILNDIMFRVIKNGVSKSDRAPCDAILSHMPILLGIYISLDFWPHCDGGFLFNRDPFD